MRRQRLDSGLTVIHVPLTGSDRFWLHATVRAGARLETAAEAGLSHFLEHMMFRGSRRFPDFARLADAFEWLGGDWNAATGPETTDFWYGGVRATAAEATGLFLDFLDHPVFSDLETERNIVLREIDGDLNDHGHSTDLGWHAASMMWPGTPLANPILGVPATVNTFTTAMLHGLRDRCHVPQGMALVVVGGDESTHERLVRDAAGLRADHKAKAPAAFAPAPAFKGPVIRWVEHSDNEHEIRLAFAIPGGECGPDAAAATLTARALADGFASRLVRRLREEKGLVYDIDAFTVMDHDIGSLEISARCALDALATFLTELMTVLAETARSGFDEDEVERARIREIVDWELLPTAPERAAPLLARWALYGRGLSLVGHRQAIESVTLAQVTDFCRRTLRAGNAALVVLGAREDDQEQVAVPDDAHLMRLLRDGLPG